MSDLQKMVFDLLFRLKKKYGLNNKVKIRQFLKEHLGIDQTEDLTNPQTAKLFVKEFAGLTNSLERKNHLYFVSKKLDFASLWPTPVMLRKSITDATTDIRYLLKLFSIHDYSDQKQGPQHKKIVNAYLFGEKIYQSKASLYRPLTKQGDPRIWFTGLKDFCEPGDELAIFASREVLVVLNFSKFDYQNIIDETDFSLPKELLFLKATGISQSASLLLQKLRQLKGIALYPQSHKTSKIQNDTDVGMAVEKALGIKPNPNKKPDFMGIELKAWRAKSKTNAHALFVQVPNWDLSSCKSFAEFVKLVGYRVRKSEVLPFVSPNAKELRCTTTALEPNAQNLMLKVSSSNDLLCEVWCQSKKENLLVWSGETLRNRLATKHPETFWIECFSDRDSKGIEIFYLKKVIYTRSPLTSQFLSLIEQGKIRLDHMIGYKKTKKGTYQLSEKGPSFKIHERDLNLLFPQQLEFTI